MVVKVTECNDIEEVLNEVGIAYRKTSGELRDSEVILSDVANRWDNFNQITKNAIGVAMAGTRQREQFNILMENWDSVGKFAQIAANSQGNSVEKMMAYNDSLEASQNRLTAAFEGFAQSQEFADMLKMINNTLASMITMLVKLQGPLKFVIGLLALPALGKNLLKIGQSVANFRTGLVGKSEDSNWMQPKKISSSLKKNYQDKKKFFLEDLEERQKVSDQKQKTSNSKQKHTKDFLGNFDDVGQAMVSAAQESKNITTSGATEAANILVDAAQQMANLSVQSEQLENQTNEIATADEINKRASGTELEGKQRINDAQVAGEIEKADAIAEGSKEKNDAVAEGIQENNDAVAEGSKEKLDAVAEGMQERNDAVAEGIIEKQSAMGTNTTSTPKNSSAMGNAVMGAGMVATNIAGTLGSAEIGRVLGVDTGIASAVGSGLQMVASAIHPIAGMVVGAIEGVAGLVLSIIRKTEEDRRKILQEGIKEANEAIQKTTSALASFSSDDFSTKFAQLQRGVLQGRNISLSDADYSEYQEMMGQLIEAVPELVSYYDENGKAVSTHTDILKRAVEILKQEQLDAQVDLIQPETVKERIQLLVEAEAEEWGNAARKKTSNASTGYLHSSERYDVLNPSSPIKELQENLNSIGATPKLHSQVRKGGYVEAQFLVSYANVVKQYQGDFDKALQAMKSAGEGIEYWADDVESGMNEYRTHLEHVQKKQGQFNRIIRKEFQQIFSTYGQLYELDEKSMSVLNSITAGINMDATVKKSKGKIVAETAKNFEAMGLQFAEALSKNSAIGEVIFEATQYETKDAQGRTKEKTIAEITQDQADAIDIVKQLRELGGGEYAQLADLLIMGNNLAPTRLDENGYTVFEETGKTAGQGPIPEMLTLKDEIEAQIDQITNNSGLKDAAKELLTSTNITASTASLFIGNVQKLQDLGIENYEQLEANLKAATTGLQEWIAKGKEAKATMSELQDVASLFTSVTDEIEKNGEISFSTFSKLLDVNVKYLGLLFDENGALRDQAEAWENIGNAQLVDSVVGLLGSQLEGAMEFAISGDTKGAQDFMSSEALKDTSMDADGDTKISLDELKVAAHKQIDQMLAITDAQIDQKAESIILSAEERADATTIGTALETAINKTTDAVLGTKPAIYDAAGILAAAMGPLGLVAAGVLALKADQATPEKPTQGDGSIPDPNDILTKKTEDAKKLKDDWYEITRPALEKQLKGEADTLLEKGPKNFAISGDNGSKTKTGKSASEKALEETNARLALLDKEYIQMQSLDELKKTMAEGDSKSVQEQIEMTDEYMKQHYYAEKALLLNQKIKNLEATKGQAEGRAEILKIDKEIQDVRKELRKLDNEAIQDTLELLSLRKQLVDSENDLVSFDEKDFESLYEIVAMEQELLKAKLEAADTLEETIQVQTELNKKIKEARDLRMQEYEALKAEKEALNDLLKSQEENQFTPFGNMTKGFIEQRKNIEAEMKKLDEVIASEEFAVMPKQQQAEILKEREELTTAHNNVADDEISRGMDSLKAMDGYFNSFEGNVGKLGSIFANAGLVAMDIPNIMTADTDQEMWDRMGEMNSHIAGVFSGMNDIAQAGFSALQKGIAFVQKIIGKVFDAVIKILHHVAQRFQNQVARDEAQISILTKSFDALNNIYSAQQELNKEIRANRLSAQYLNQEDRARMLNDADYNNLTTANQQLEKQIDYLTKTYKENIRTLNVPLNGYTNVKGEYVPGELEKIRKEVGLPGYEGAYKGRKESGLAPTDEELKDRGFMDTFKSVMNWEWLTNILDKTGISGWVDGVVTDIGTVAAAMFPSIADQSVLTGMIEGQYDRLVEILMKQLEVNRAQLNLQKAQMKLDNALSEKNTKLLIDGQWRMVANQEDVLAAQNEVMDAQAKVDELEREKTQLLQLDAMETQVDEQRRLAYFAEVAAAALEKLKQMIMDALQMLSDAIGIIADISTIITNFMTMVSQMLGFILAPLKMIAGVFGIVLPFASGTPSAPGGPTLTDELGPELKISTPKGTFSNMEYGTAVVPANLSKNLMKWGQYNPSQFKTGESTTKIIGGSSTTVHIENIELPNVTEPEDFAIGLGQAIRRHGMVLSNKY